MHEGKRSWKLFSDFSLRVETFEVNDYDFYWGDIYQMSESLLRKNINEMASKCSYELQVNVMVLRVYRYVARVEGMTVELRVRGGVINGKQVKKGSWSTVSENVSRKV
jgi:hypothetical protein